MDLSERKLKILEAIITDYIQVGEPVASRTIAKKHDLGVSSATIRNEMSDLEDLGLIVQPHTSAGRIPSDKGYRLYVDELIQRKDDNYSEMEILREVINKNIDKIDFLMKETAKTLSILTNHVTFITEPKSSTTVIKQIQLMPVDEEKILLVVIVNKDNVKNKMINIGTMIDIKYLYSLSILLNNIFKGKTINDIEKETIDELKKNLNNDLVVLVPVLDALVNILKSEDTTEVYTSGVNNILSHPEFSDLEEAKKIFKALEERELLVTLLGDDAEENVQILIGSENNIEQMRSCSIVRSRYSTEDGSYGKIGIIGPTRMDYTRVLNTMDSVTKSISEVLKANKDNNKKE